MKSKIKELKLRLDQEEFERFAQAAFQRGMMKHQNALKQAVDAWLTLDSPQVPTKEGDSEPVIHESGTSGMPGSVSLGTKIKNIEAREQDSTWESNIEAHEALDYILQNGPPGMAEDIKGNLKWFAFAAKVAHDAQAGKLSSAAAHDIEALLKESSRTESEDRDSRRLSEQASGGKGHRKGTGT